MTELGPGVGPGVVPAGAGTIHAARGSVMAFKAVAAQTGGDFSFMERTLPPGGRRPLPHRHVNCSEAFWVLDGVITFVLDGVEFSGHTDDFLLVPRGAGHTFGNGGDTTARLLVLHAPAMDAYFAELDALWSRETPPDAESERALMARYGMEPA
jgi:mannose-6-phosphate isomerase-like protein (cupin superfamily)